MSESFQRIKTALRSQACITRIAVAILLAVSIFAGLTLLGRYIAYDSFCLEIMNRRNQNRGYVFRAASPDLETAERFLKDYLVSEFSQAAPDLGYPAVESGTENWLIFNTYDPYIFHRDIDLYEPRTVYWINLDIQGRRVTISYHRESDRTEQVQMGIRVYVQPAWLPGTVPSGKDPFITVHVARTVPVVDDVLTLKIYNFIENALDQIRKCQP